MRETVPLRLTISKSEAKKMTRIARWEKESERVNITLRPRASEDRNANDKS